MVQKKINLASAYSDRKNQYKALPFLTMLYVCIMLITIATAYKLVNVCGINVVASTLILPIWLLLADIIAEVYGYKMVRKIIWLGLLCEFLFIFITYFLIHLPSPTYWHHQAAYNFVFSKLPRVFLGSFAGVMIGSFLNAYILTKWKVAIKGKYFWMRSFFSSVFGEILFTIIVIVCNYLGVYAMSHLIELALVSIFFKSLSSLIYAIPGSMACRLLKRYERLDIYDTQTNFNPFRI